MEDYIWYASYGSNISKERFMCYIQGGTPEGATKNYIGCKNKSAPLDQKPIQIPHELYFAKSAEVWHGGGVCFINPQEDQNTQTLGHMYLITRDQFDDVVQQENKSVEKIEIDLEKVIHQKSLIVRENSWYGKLLYLGEEKGAPIFTFTNEKYLENEINAPDRNYLRTIIKGLSNTHKLNRESLKQYFQSKSGVSPSIVDEAIHSIPK